MPGRSYALFPQKSIILWFFKEPDQLKAVGPGFEKIFAEIFWIAGVFAERTALQAQEKYAVFLYGEYAQEEKRQSDQLLQDIFKIIFHITSGIITFGNRQKKASAVNKV